MTLGGIVLAGGRSTRMGAAKAGLDWHGVPLVVHVANTVRAAVDGPVIVVSAPGQRLPEGLTVVEDPVEGRGPLQGLAAGLAALAADVAFVCATDQPFAAAILPALTAAMRETDPAVLVAGQPLGALYRTSLAPAAAQLLGTGDRSLRAFARTVGAREIDADPAPLRSLDTPVAYRAALDLQ